MGSLLKGAEGSARSPERGILTLRCTDSVEAWRAVLEDRADEPDPLLPRWRRLHRLGRPVERSTFLDALDDPHRLAERRSRHHELCRVAEDCVPRLGAYLDERGYEVTLGDLDGVLLRSWGGSRFRDVATAIRLIEGAHWSEDVRGTNALGVALEERRPVAVIAGAHYERMNKVTTSHATPIFDHRGEPIGVLGAVALEADADGLATLALVALARSLECALGHRRSLRRIVDILGNTGTPALLVEQSGEIVAGNEDASRVLGRRVEVADSVASRLGVTWRSLAETALGATSLRIPRPEDDDRELLVHVDAASDRDGELETLLVRLEETAPRLPPPSAFASFFAADARVVELKERAARLARSAVPILIRAEHGAGKSRLARAIHEASHRAPRPFVAVHGSSSATELFGCTHGAAYDGALALAEGGTLFVDDIAELTPSLQAMLLRVLDEGSSRRVDDPTPRRADVRVIGATSCDLRALVEEGGFRADLAFRMTGAELELPPLRERSDVVELARAILLRLRPEVGRLDCDVSELAASLFRAYTWPGNVRQLEAALRHALLVGDGPWIEVPHLPRELSHGLWPLPPAVDERAVYTRAIVDADGRVDAAARLVGVSRATFYRRLKKLGLTARR